MNLKRFILCALCFLLNASILCAQESYRLGYCPDDIPSDAKAYGVAGAANRLSAAVRLPRTKMLRYQGGRVTAVRFAVHAEGLSTASVWLRNNLNERSRMVQSVGDLQDGWNEVTLNRPLEIEGEDLYVGFTVAQAEGTKGILSAGDGTDDSSFIATDNDWQDMHRFGVGALFIQAVVEADVPTRDLAVVSMGTETLLPTEQPDISWNVTIENLGEPTQERVKVSYLLDDAEISSEYVSNLTTEETKTLSYRTSLPTLTAGAHNVAAAVSFESGESDQRPANDTLRQTVYVYADSYPRNVLLEHFTSIPCVNCPETDKILEEVVPQRSDVIWTAHHVGYKDDQFTIEAARPLTSFGVIGNPEVMLDRSVVPATKSETPAFVLTPGDTEGFSSFLDYAVSQPAFVRLDVQAEIESDELTVTIDAEATDFFTSLYPNTRLCAYLVEDGCEASVGQAGNPTKFTHDNVVRAIPTTLSGQAARFEGSTYQTTFTLAKDATWDANRLRAVAFLCETAKPGSGQPTGRVLNAAQAFFTEQTGITQPASDLPTHRSQTYDLQGRCINSHIIPSGVYIQGGKKLFIR